MVWGASYLLRKLFRWCIALQGIGMHMWLNICVGTIGIAHWDALFVRLLQDWELDSVEVFSALLYSTMVVRNKEDKLVLLATYSGSFEVKSYYTVLSCRNSHSFPWKVKVPSKVAFFAWTAAKGEILTLDNLSRIFVLLIDAACVGMTGNRWITFSFIVYAFNLWII